MKKVIIHHNTGLGDHLICNGLVNYISKSKKVFLICNKKNFSSIQYLYSENKNVRVIPIFRNNKIEKILIKLIGQYFNDIDNNAEKLLSKLYSKISRIETLYIGFDDVVYPEWDKCFYKIVELDFKIRYDYFKLPKKLPKKILSIPEDFILIQDSSSQGKYSLKINSDKNRVYLKETETKNFFENLLLVHKAKEIHCIDSSLAHLIESIELKDGQEIYFHDIERYNQEATPDSRFNMRHEWKIIKYKDSSSFY